MAQQADVGALEESAGGCSGRRGPGRTISVGSLMAMGYGLIKNFIPNGFLRISEGSNQKNVLYR
jgi:hypothetical protein